MVVPVDFFKAIPYFSGLSDKELESITRLMTERVVGRGETVVFEGETAEALYFVASGVVKVFKTSVEGKEQILAIVHPGEAFNEVSVFDGNPNPAAAEALGPVVLYRIGGEELDVVLRDYLPVARNAIRVMAGRLRHLVSLVEDLSFRHVIGRVAKILIEQAGDGDAPAPRLTQQEIAAMAGTAREVVGRSLKSLEEDGAIRLDRHRIVIADGEALREIAQTSL